MDVFEAIESRRAIKHFDPEHRMTDAEIERLLDAAILSPTAFNLQHWRFVLVKDLELRKKVREAAWGQAQVTDASLLIVLCANVSAWEKPQPYWAGAPQEVQDFLLPKIDAYYRDRERVQVDEAMRSCGIVAQTIMLAAKAIGYDSCPMDGFDFEEVSKLIELPPDHVIAMFVAVGKGTRAPWPRPGQLARAEVVVENTFAK